MEIISNKKSYGKSGKMFSNAALDNNTLLSEHDGCTDIEKVVVQMIDATKFDGQNRKHMT